MLTNYSIKWKYRIYLFTILILVSGDLYSQTILINGKIKSHGENTLKHANVLLLRESVVKDNTISDSIGSYSISTTIGDSCEMIVQLLGYKTIQKKVTLRNDTTINFTTVPISLNLEEVSIVGKKNLIQVKPDGYLINIKGNIVTEGKETTDLLKQLPGVITTNNSINIFGKSSVIVYINERQVRLSGQELLNYLNTLPPDIIENVEIISIPSAQYDVEGNIGIIKINSDKNINPGWKEYIKVGGIRNSYNSYMLSVFANYTGKKTFFEGNISNGSFSYLNESKYYSEFPNKTVRTFNPKKQNYSYTDLHSLFGYNFSKESVLIINLQIPIHIKQTVSDIENHTSYIDPILDRNDSTIFSDGNTIMSHRPFNTELYFKHSFKDKKSFFSTSAAYYSDNKINRRDFTSVTKIGNVFQAKEMYLTEGSQAYNIITSKFDFAFPLLNWNINTGVKLTSINSQSDNKLFILIDGTANDSLLLNNKYDYTEKLQAIYFSFEKNISNWSFKGGLRCERTATIAKSILVNSINSDKYIDFFPTAYISYKLTKGISLSLSYSKRIDRAPYQLLDPFRWYISKYDYAVGNPFLKPSYLNNFELSLIHHNAFSAKLYYSGQKDKIGQYVILDSLNILNQIQLADNFLNAYNYGFSVYKLFRVKKLLESVIQGDIYYSKYISNKEEVSDVSGIGGTINLNSIFFIHNNFHLELNLSENIPGLYNYRIMNNSFSLDASLNYTNKKKDFEIKLYLSDILKTANSEYYYYTGGVKQVYNNYFDSRTAKLVISWRLGNWYNKTSKLPSSSNTEEKARL